MGKIQRIYPALPTTQSELAAARVKGTNATLIDVVEEIHKALVIESPRYRSLIGGIFPEDSVEGSLKSDDTMAAVMIRDWAVQHKQPFVAERKIHTLEITLGYVLGRYNMRRYQRRRLVVETLVEDVAEDVVDGDQAVEG